MTGRTMQNSFGTLILVANEQSATLCANNEGVSSQKVNYLAAAASLLNQVAQSSGPNEWRQ